MHSDTPPSLASHVPRGQSYLEEAVYLEPSASLRRLQLSTVYSSQHAVGPRELSNPLLATLSPLAFNSRGPSSMQV